MVPDPGGAGQAGERRTSIDGMDVTDPFGGDFNAVNLNADAIQDVEVKALGAEASDGGSMVGQFLNVSRRKAAATTCMGPPHSA